MSLNLDQLLDRVNKKISSKVGWCKLHKLPNTNDVVCNLNFVIHGKADFKTLQTIIKQLKDINQFVKKSKKVKKVT